MRVEVRLVQLAGGAGGRGRDGEGGDAEVAQARHHEGRGHKHRVERGEDEVLVVGGVAGGLAVERVLQLLPRLQAHLVQNVLGEFQIVHIDVVELGGLFLFLLVVGRLLPFRIVGGLIGFGLVGVGGLFLIGGLVGRLVGVGGLVGGLGLGGLGLLFGGHREGDALGAQVTNIGKVFVGQSVVHSLGLFHLVLLDRLAGAVGPQHEGGRLGVVGRAVLGGGEVRGGIGHRHVDDALAVGLAREGVGGKRALGVHGDVGHAVGSLGHRHSGHLFGGAVGGAFHRNGDVGDSRHRGGVGRVHGGQLVGGHARGVEGNDAVGVHHASALGGVRRVGHAQGVGLLGEGALGGLHGNEVGGPGGVAGEGGIGGASQLGGKRQLRLGGHEGDRGGGGLGVVVIDGVGLAAAVLVAVGHVGAHSEAGAHGHRLGGRGVLGEPGGDDGQLGADGHLAAGVVHGDAVLVLHAFEAQHDGAGKAGGQFLGGALLVLLAVLGVGGPALGQHRHSQLGAHVVGGGAAGLPLLFRERGAEGAVVVLVEEGGLEGEGHGVGVFHAAEVPALEGDVGVAQGGGEREARAGNVVGVVGGAQGAGHRERERGAGGEGFLELVFSGRGSVQDAVGLLGLDVVGEGRHDLVGVDEILGQVGGDLLVGGGIGAGGLFLGGLVVGGFVIGGLVALFGVAFALGVVGGLVEVLVVHLVQQLVAGAGGHGGGLVADDHAAGLLDGVAVPAGQHQQHRQHRGNDFAEGVQLAGRVAADDAGVGLIAGDCGRALGAGGAGGRRDGTHRGKRLILRGMATHWRTPPPWEFSRRRGRCRRRRSARRQRRGYADRYVCCSCYPRSLFAPRAGPDPRLQGLSPSFSLIKRRLCFFFKSSVSL